MMEFLVQLLIILLIWGPLVAFTEKKIIWHHEYDGGTTFVKGSFFVNFDYGVLTAFPKG